MPIFEADLHEEVGFVVPGRFMGVIDPDGRTLQPSLTPSTSIETSTSKVIPAAADHQLAAQEHARASGHVADLAPIGGQFAR